MSSYQIRDLRKSKSQIWKVRGGSYITGTSYIRDLMTHVISPCYEDFQFSLLICYGHMGQVRKMRLYCYLVLLSSLTHWGRVMHICVVKLTIIDSDNGLSPERRQAIIWTNVGILLIGPLRTNFSEILIGFQTFSNKSLQLIWRSGTRRWNLRVPDLQMSCNDFT